MTGLGRGGDLRRPRQWGLSMKKRRIKAGPLLALGLLIMGTGYVVTEITAPAEPEVEMQTSLPLARI